MSGDLNRTTSVVQTSESCRMGRDAAFFASFGTEGEILDSRIGALVAQMMAWDRASHERINHNLKVLSNALTIASGEGLDGVLYDTVLAAAVVHDAGIRPALEKYGSSAGPYQEKEGPKPAARMLRAAGYPEPIVDRVCELVAHHHTYQPVLGPDHQILLEADLLVNMDEQDEAARQGATPSVFRTDTGKRLYRLLFSSEG